MTAPNGISSGSREGLDCGVDRTIRLDVVQPNSFDMIETRVDTLSTGRVWGMLGVRSALALGLQAVFALGFVIAGVASPWRAAADWWLVWFAAAEVINLGLLTQALRLERLRLRDLYKPNQHDRRGDLMWLVIGLAGTVPLGLVPNLLLAQLLFGDLQTASDLMFRSIPLWAAWTMVGAFPIVHAVTELPTYFGYVMPRLQVLTGRRMKMVFLTASVLSAQHVFLPLLFDWRFIVWRLLMFLPFALWVGWLIHRRPTALPYLAAVHGLLGLTLPLYILQASLIP